MSKVGNYKVPISGHGSLEHYAYPSLNASHNAGNWRDNDPFEATIRLDSMRSGRSAKYVIWTNVDTGATYPMFVVDLIELTTRAGIVNGVATVKGPWMVRKRGQNYGLILAPEGS